MSPPWTANAPKPMRLLDQVRDKLRNPHYSPRTEDANLGSLKFFKNGEHLDPGQPPDWMQTAELGKP